MDAEMREAPEIVVPEGLDEAARFPITCPQEVTQVYTQIWTELLQWRSGASGLTGGRGRTGAAPPAPPLAPSASAGSPED
jgi:hypothetical protein